jgi:16S rRNA (cytosine1402-N4)-methyltransferase
VQKKNQKRNNYDSGMKKDHLSIMGREVVECINAVSGGVYVDCTFGGGGHSEMILGASEVSRVVGVDRDVNNKKYAEQLQGVFGERIVFVNDLFSNLENIVAGLGLEKVDGVLYDLGISSMQVDNSEFGFSFNKDGPLLMQMGKNAESAEDVVNNYSQEELANLIYIYGDERNSRKIATEIVKERERKRITTTARLAKIVEKAVPFYDKIHPATKTFQAIRIKVNDELREVEISLQQALRCVRVGGRIVVITFHSLEERVIKNFLREYHRRPNFFNRGEAVNWHVREVVAQEPWVKIVAKRVSPREEELLSNPRARSAKLWVVEKTRELNATS